MLSVLVGLSLFLGLAHSVADEHCSMTWAHHINFVTKILSEFLLCNNLKSYCCSLAIILFCSPI